MDEFDEAKKNTFHFASTEQVLKYLAHRNAVVMATRRQTSPGWTSTDTQKH